MNYVVLFTQQSTDVTLWLSYQLNSFPSVYPSGIFFKYIPKSFNIFF